MRMVITPAEYHIRIEQEGDVVEGLYNPVTRKATGPLGRAFAARPELAEWLQLRVESEVPNATVMFDGGGPGLAYFTGGDFLGAFRDWSLYAKKEVGNWQNYKLVSPFGRAYYFAVNQTTGKIGGKGLPSNMPPEVFDWIRRSCGFANS